MSNRAKKSSKKPVPQNAILIDRRSFLSVIGITSVILDAMTDEYEAVRVSKEMSPEAKKACKQLLTAHIGNVTNLGAALSNCVVDPTDIEGVKLPSLN